MIQPNFSFKTKDSPTRPTLRPKQVEAVEAALSSPNGILCEPTGSGKSLIIGGIADRIDHGILILQPSVEILESNYEKAIAFGIDAEIYSASAKRKVVGHVTYATIGSVINKIDLFRHCKTLITDECHLVNAKGGQYLQLINELKPERLVGPSATPYRLSSSSFGSSMKLLHRTQDKIFKGIIHVTNPRYLIENNWLMEPHFFESDSDDSMLQLNSTGANFSDQSIARFVKANDLRGKALELAAMVADKHRHILIYMETVADSVWLVNALRAKGIGSDEINALTEQKERGSRKRKLDLFRSGECQIMVNVGTLTTGFDFPALDCIIDASPTNSAALHYQKVGRIVRFYAGKQAAFYDLAGNYRRMGNPLNYATLKNVTGNYEVYSERGRVTTRIMTKEPECKTKITFGKHSGARLEEIPDDYLRWAIENLKADKKHIFYSEIMRREIVSGLNKNGRN